MNKKTKTKTLKRRVLERYKQINKNIDKLWQENKQLKEKLEKGSSNE